MASIQKCSKILHALSHEHRYAVVKQVMHGPMSAGDLSQRLDVEQSLLSHHLSILREEAIVQCSRLGKQIVYDLSQKVKDSEANELNLGCCKISFNS